MTDPEVTWTEVPAYHCWTAVLKPKDSAAKPVEMIIEFTKNKKCPFDVMVGGAVVGFKRTLVDAKACAVRQAKLRLEAEENAR
ncbi:MAG: hypothetical protein M0R06_03835 [Sphaerochaeta sp.]|jgi:hypothetical protein|nr:hypothetical protein [Sphaerochaeta sp.]